MTDGLGFNELMSTFHVRKLIYFSLVVTNNVAPFVTTLTTISSSCSFSRAASCLSFTSTPLFLVVGRMGNLMHETCTSKIPEL